MLLRFKRAFLLILCFAFLTGMLGVFTVSSEGAVYTSPMVSIGNRFTVALRSDGTAVAWGDNTNGTLGNGTTTASLVPVEVTMPTDVRFSAISAGYDHVVALALDGTVWTWGSDANGQLGNRSRSNEQENESAPKQVLGALQGKTVVEVAAGTCVSLALTSDGKIYTWGSSQNGILGISGDAKYVTPTELTLSESVFFTHVFIGSQTAAAIGTKDDHNLVWLWGKNDSLQLGDSNSEGTHYTPTCKTTTNSYNALSVVLGDTHSSFLLEDGSVVGFGKNTNGQFGNGTTSETGTTVFKSASFINTTISAVAAGSRHMIALSEDGKAYAWGQNSSGQLGLGSSAGNTVTTPTEVTCDSWASLISVAAGYHNTAVIDSQGFVYMCGDNTGGQLGNNTNVQSNTPVSVFDVGGSGSLCLLVSSSATKEYSAQITMTASIPAPTFCVSIPASIDVGELKQKTANEENTVKSTSFEVGASNVSNLFGEKQIEVSISGANDKFVLLDGQHQLAYSIYDAAENGNQLQSGDVFAVFTANGTKTGRMDIDQTQITREGTYEGTVTFTVKVTDIVNEEE